MRKRAEWRGLPRCVKKHRQSLLHRRSAGGAQVCGWLDAWTPAPSAYAVKARNTADVAAAVNFARDKNLRLVVKGTGHSYLGTSSAPDSLLVWTRGMNAVTLQDSFLGQGCEGKIAPVPAVTAEAGRRLDRCLTLP